MHNKKVFILLPDGIGLRNFAFTNFYKIGIESGFDITFWNNTPFNLTELGFKEIKIGDSKLHPLTDILKRARTEIDLDLNSRKTRDDVYESYRFPLAFNNSKNRIKSSLTYLISSFYSSEKGVVKVRKWIKNLERETDRYKESINTLKKEKPNLVFCTNQRPITAVATILAAQDLGIPTATFIFSWDNLPKATMVIETDFYFVWSNHMKEELLFYYPYINENQIFITGTPQFEKHFDKEALVSREQFFKEYGLEMNKKYICYSGDDITTSPNDPKYLEDTAIAIRKLNDKGFQLGIVFRRCPVDFSNRFDKVLEKNSDIIKVVNPKWKKIEDSWNAILPTQEDLVLQVNTIAHTEMVINLGSSMVFDYVSFEKPCFYINYDVPNPKVANWSVKKIYKYVHFSSMQDKNAVGWINNPDEISDKIESILKNNKQTITHAKNWFKKINQHPAELASQRIWQAINTVIS